MYYHFNNYPFKQKIVLFALEIGLKAFSVDYLLYLEVLNLLNLMCQILISNFFSQKLHNSPKQ